MYKHFQLTTDARCHYNEQLEKFKEEHIKETEHYFRIKEDLPGFRKNVLIFNDTYG